MNTIYQKLKPKRKYHKTPPCGHTDGYCDMEHCRMQYAIKEPKGKLPPLDKTFKHRDKVVKRIREIELARLDAEQEFIQQGQTDKDFHIVYKGEFAKRKAQIKKYKKTLWYGLGIIILVALLYPLVIFIGDLFY